METINKYYIKLSEWVQKNPGKATLIGIFALGFILGALIL